MRRALLLLAVLAVGLSGCGSSSSPGAPANPLVSELSYFPVTTPFVLKVSTSPSSRSAASMKALEQRFPQYSFLQAALMAKLQQIGISYQHDIHPLLGNPAMMGAAGASLSGLAHSFMIVWVTKSQSALAGLLHKFHTLRSAGSRDGASLYTLGNSGALAVSGPTVMLAANRSILLASLDRHAHNQGITSAQYSSDFTGLDPNAAVDMFGDLTGVLSTAKAAQARQIPWVQALHGYGVSISSASNGLTIRFRLDTSGGTLTPAELPIAGGTASPAVVAGLPIQASLRDPAQIVKFVVSVEKATSARQYASYLRSAAKIKRTTGLSINQLLGQLTGNVTVDSDTHTTLIRVSVANPATAGGMLRKLVSSGALERGSRVTSLGPNAYSISHVKTGRTEALALIGHDLVVGVPARGSDLNLSALRAFASAPAAALPGTTGSVAFRLELSHLITLTSKTPPSSAERVFLNLLGDLTGSVSATPSAVTGVATLAIK
jgi:hypothetical protein